MSCAFATSPSYDGKERGVVAVWTDEDIATLQLRLLPPGGDALVALLRRHRDSILLTAIALEGVPLIIIARQGILARLPVSGVMKKISQPEPILEAARHFLAEGNKVYLYVNLPEIPLPASVREAISAAVEETEEREVLRQRINDALDRGDKPGFMRLTQMLRAKEHPGERTRSNVRRN